MSNDEQWMAHALSLAKQAELQGEVPVGAVIVRDNI
ncbi:MAG: tRNA-specific adenosine deaminase, partial [Gammaproteobacteria bacterium]